MPPDTLVELYKYIIGGLVTAVTGLVTAVGMQFRSAERVNSSRLGERDTLNEALTGSNEALMAIKTAIEHRNVMMEELSKLITQQGMTFTLFVETVKVQQDVMDRERTAVNQAVTTMAQSIQAMNMRMEVIVSRLDDVLREVKE